MKLGTRAVILLMALSFYLALSCSTPSRENSILGKHLPQDKNGDYYSDLVTSSNLYINNAANFTLDFDNSWRLFPHYNSMPAEMRSTALSFREQGAGLLLFGIRKSQAAGMRITLEQASTNLEEYFELIREANRPEVTDQGHSRVVINGTDMIRWKFTTPLPGQDGDLHFLEYQFRSGSGNLRVSFWTMDRFFQVYKPRFEKVMNTFQFMPEGGAQI